MSSGLPLIRGDDLNLPIAWRGGEPVSRHRYLADVNALCERLPGAGPMLNVTADRYHFAVGLGAAMLRGQENLMPPNHTPDMMERLHGLFPSTYGLADDAAPPVQLPMVWHARTAPAGLGSLPVPSIDANLLVARVLTSGSTGAPVPHDKHWGLLVANTRAGVQRLAEQMGRTDLAGVTLVATVPPQHMYGFESTVLVALLGGAAFDAERPFYPADIARALARAPRPRVLVTTPFHLKTLLDAGLELPPIDLTVCATAPLSPQLAARAESALAAPLMEIYGCTEAGQVATRRTTEGPEWHTYEGLRLTGDADHAVVQGGHVPEPTRLADVLEVVNAQTFRLLGRSNDLINIAGKRSSLSHLNYHLNSIAGVQDGSFWLPPEEPAHGVKRLTAFVVAPGIAPAALHEHVLGALRQRVDAAFLPRRIVAVPALPREPTGKLPSGPFNAWAAAALERAGPRG
jgi:acyl-coenzyme A synthetase/AMP-(fatty) acid ligase